MVCLAKGKGERQEKQTSKSHIMLQSFQIHINGIVQGVGFRPLVYRLATEMQLKGYVKNGNDGVSIFFNASLQEAKLFLKKIKLSVPARSKIISAELKKAADAVFPDFSIIFEDDISSEKKVLISPDIALCNNCKNELHDKNNRRYRYPFITCTQCGPRYSIIHHLPYERDATAMKDFTMCKTCNNEYTSVANGRFFSQTNSCADCGIELSILNNPASILSKNTGEVLSHIKNFLQQGKIIAVKGVGGYLLLCDAACPAAIQELRRRKHRPSKPFAVLYPDIETVQADFELNGQEKELLKSGEAPILLLHPQGNIENNLAIHNIAPGLTRLGVMLPCSPLLELIASDFGKPLIATSGNISGSPIIYKDEDALLYLFDIADFIVTYNREIVIPLDDSVIQISKHTNQQIILRRSRGYAPSFLNYKSKTSACILSTGAFLKGSFTLAVNGNVFISQFLGSGEAYESQLMYKHTLAHWLSLYQVKPEIVIADLHPGYFSVQYAAELANKYEIDLKQVQHHEAHFAAVLAENNLINNTEPIMGVVWDGAGLGSDGNIWGGEFFKYKNNEMRRCYHFDYFPAIAGDKLASEPRLAALCVAHNTWPNPDKLQEKFTDAEWNNYQALIDNTNLYTSSAGRIFDAVACLLWLCDKQTYEGEAAMCMQALAEKYVEANGFVMDDSYFKEALHDRRIPTASLIRGIITDMEKGKAKSYIAAKFHYSLVCLVDTVAGNIDVKNICFTGGVFQNALLAGWIQKELCGKYRLYFHNNLSPNDESISFGQLVYYENQIRTAVLDEMGLNQNNYVLSNSR